MDDPLGGRWVGSVFISYSSKDRDRVAVIADALRTMGLEVWWDREIPVATTYHEHIKKQLDEAQAVVVVWSPASVASQYVLWEAQKAHRRGILVPVVIAEADLPPDFFLIQAADLTRWRGNTADPEWKRLTGALSRLVSQGAAAPSLPPVSPAAVARPAASPPAAKAKPAPRPRPPAREVKAASRPWYTRRSGVAALGGAGLLAVVVALVLMSGGGTDPTTTLAAVTTVVAPTTTALNPTSAPTTTTTVPPSTTVPAPVPDLVWSRVWTEQSDVFGGTGTQRMMGLVAWGSGFVAVGEDSTAGNDGGAVWISADGSAWDKVAGNADIEGVMYGIAAGGPGLVAVGYRGEGGAGVWTSTDGIIWDPVPYDAFVFGDGPEFWMHAVASADPGLVAVGEAGGDAVGEGGGFGAAWTSLDGITWERVDADFGSGPLTSVVAGEPLGIVAAGRAESPNGDWDAAVWTSRGGLTWERVDSEDLGGDGDQWINAVTRGGPGLIAVGAEQTLESGRDAAVWASSDGLTWVRVKPTDVFSGSGVQEMFGVAVGDLGVFAVGSTTNGDWDAAVWTSSDGTTWEQVVVPTSQDDAGVFDGGQMQAVVVTDASVVGVGIFSWQSGEVTAGQPIGYGEEPDAVGWVGLAVGTN
jgi:TIR domain